MTYIWLACAGVALAWFVLRDFTACEVIRDLKERLGAEQKKASDSEARAKTYADALEGTVIEEVVEGKRTIQKVWRGGRVMCMCPFLCDAASEPCAFDLAKRPEVTP